MWPESEPANEWLIWANFSWLDSFVEYSVTPRPMYPADGRKLAALDAIAEPNHWFTYYFWLDDAKAPDFARTVDIHRKPGYDPVELFVDPGLKLLARRLLQKNLGLRMLMDVIPLQPELVRGTHGRQPATPHHGPLLIGTRKDLAIEYLDATDVKSMILDHYRCRP